MIERVALLREISDWKLEAKLEDTQRYFYHTPDVAKLVDGSKSYVIGRKGTGKTAIREFLHQQVAPNCFTEKLSFKNFPFNELYQRANSQYTPPNQYITLWKGIIYLYVVKMMLKNEGIDPALRRKLSPLFGTDVVAALSRSVAKLSDPELKFSFLGLELGAKMSRHEASAAMPWVQRCEILEEVIAANIDSSRYVLLFDELDEDFRDVGDSQQLSDYKALITSLFKAVQEVKSVFTSPRYRIQPVIFLRDDIYELLTDSDKTKWDDLKLSLSWSSAEIAALLAFRISRAINPIGKSLAYVNAIEKVFYGTKMKGSAKGGSPFHFILSRTLIRPRDFIAYFRTIAQEALARNQPVDGGVIRTSLLPYSNYLRGDIQDEIQGVLPDVREILDVIAKIRSPEFTTSRFTREYQRAVTAKLVADRSVVNVLATLFHFSVIGNNVVGGEVFRYTHPGARFNPEEPIRVLRGLLPSLQIPDQPEYYRTDGTAGERL